jgi:aminotransferase
VSFAGDDGRLREGLNRMSAFVERLKAPEPAPTAREDSAETAELPSDSEARKPVFSRT